MKRTPFSRAEKRLLIGGSLAVLLLGGLGLSLRNAKSSGAIPPRAPMPRPNGFDLYIAAANAMTRPNPPVDATNDRTKRTPQYAAKFYTPARRAAWVKTNAKTWNLMAQARAAQTQHPDVRGNFVVNLPYKPLRELARGKSIEAKHFLDLERPDLALQSGLDTMEMGRDIEQGAPLLGSLVGIAIEAIGAASIENVPPLLDAKSAKNGARRLEKITAGGSSSAEVLREEKWGALIAARNNFGIKPNPTAGILMLPMTASIGPMMDKNIAEISKPYPLQTNPPAPTGFFNRYAAVMYLQPKRYGFNVARRETSESQLLLRLALRAYRLETGTYPDNLAQLAPKTLQKIPRDPFGRGEAMRYQKKGDSYRAWSIGPDGKDDQGVSIALKPGKKRVVMQRESLGDMVIGP